MKSAFSRGSVALLAAMVMVWAGVPATGAEQPLPISTDPSAEEAPGSLDDLDLPPWWLLDDQVDSVTGQDEPDEIVVEDGVTQPVFSYADAIRETVRIPGAVGSEDSGAQDIINVDIIRPAASDGALQVPTIIVPSPYYRSPGRGRAGENKPETDGPIDFFPLYYDNYFVPRGYAVALLDLSGTRNSTGCLDIGGPAEIDNTVKFVEWLAGSGVALDLDGNAVDAHWSNGLSAMVGKSWDGTVANGVAARGAEGLATIVPIAAISSWHQWFWHNGAQFSGHTPLSLAGAIQNVPNSRCQGVRSELAAGGPIADPNHPFWAERDFIRDAADVKASVFVVHGLNDYNVKPNNYGVWWDALAAHDVPRKIWLSQVAHEKGFDFRRDEWLVTVNRWFDRWLHEIENGIMDEPVADVEHAPDQWATYTTWPGGKPTFLRFGQPDGPDDSRPGALSMNRRVLQPGTQTFLETHQNRNNAASNGFTARGDRLVFMTDELTEAVRVSGTTNVSLELSVDGVASNSSLSAYLVDYGATERTNWAVSGGIQDLQTMTCFGKGTMTDTGCYRDVVRRTHTQPQEVVARGWANAAFVLGQPSLDPAETYRLEWDILTDDYTFFPGHRIGIVISGVDTSAIRNPGTRNNVEVSLPGSRVQLPIVGGSQALRRALATVP